MRTPMPGRAWWKAKLREAVAFGAIAGIAGAGVFRGGA